MTAQPIDRRTNYILKRLEDLISLGRQTFYREGYRKGISDEEILGCIIAKKCKWTRGPIMQTFMSALEDANFHSLAAEIEKL